ncbi:MAG: Holliday junction resolvase RuvX [Bacteriovoracia bacterium]
MSDYFNYTYFQKFLGKNILAIDFGKKFTGLSTFRPGSDPYPLPYDRIRYVNDAQLMAAIQKVCLQEDIEVTVIGIPLLLDGGETSMTREVKKFAVSLGEYLNPIPLFLQDETLSSFEAKDRMENSPAYNFKYDPTKVDALAASIILEDFIKNS